MNVQAEAISRPAAMKLAREMHEGGWSVYAIQRYLARRGLEVGWQTVKRWAIPEWWDAEREASRARERRRWADRTGGRLGRKDQTTETKLVRLVALHEQAGLAPASIAKVLAFDFGDPITEDQVRYALKVGRYPKRLEAAACDTGIDTDAQPGGGRS